MSETTGRPPGSPRTLGFWVLTVLLSLVVAVIGAAAALGVVALQQQTYQSTAVLTLDQPRVLAKTTDEGEVAKLAALRLKYAGLATTLQFADLVSTTSGLPAAEIHGAIVTTVPPDSLLFTVGARSTDATHARMIANAAAHGLADLVHQQNISARVPPGEHLQLTVVTPAGVAVKVSPSHNRELGAAGVTAAVLFVLAMSVQTLRRRD